MKKIISYVLVFCAAFAAVLGLSACGATQCSHQWTERTCTTPKTCMLCSATEGGPAGHTGGTATDTIGLIC